MTRRRDTFFGKVIAVFSKLPWWLWAALAIVSYLGLHSMAASEVTAILLAGNLDGLVDQTQGQVFMSVGQYLLPVVFVLLAALSVYGRYSYPNLHDGMTITPRQSVLQSMSWQQFEMLVGESFRRKGYSITEKGGPRSQTDFVLKKSGEISLVHCKQWRAIRVGVNTLRELQKDMADRKAKNGFVVTTGVFTEEAVMYAKDKHIELLNGNALRSLTRGVSVPAKVYRDPLSVLTRGAPYCPECQGRMTKKRASKGPHAGTVFWRCLRHPDCKGKRPV